MVAFSIIDDCETTPNSPVDKGKVIKPYPGENCISITLLNGINSGIGILEINGIIPPRIFASIILIFKFEKYPVIKCFIIESTFKLWFVKSLILIILFIGCLRLCKSTPKYFKYDEKYPSVNFLINFIGG